MELDPAPMPSVWQSWRRYFLTGCHFSHPLARLSRFALGRLAPADLTNSFLPSSFFLPFSLSFLLWFSLPFGVWEKEFFKTWKIVENKTICSHIAELFSAAGENFGYLKCELHSRTPLVAIKIWMFYFFTPYPKFRPSGQNFGKRIFTRSIFLALRAKIFVLASRLVVLASSCASPDSMIMTIMEVPIGMNIHLSKSLVFKSDFCVDRTRLWI